MPKAPDSQPGYDSDTGEVERLLEAATRLPANERKAFLSSECKERPALKAKVLSLVEHVGAADAFFERLEASVRRSLSDLTDDVAGGEDIGPDSRIGRYRILERIGAGGMGTVYRARDESLDRDVALKLIPSHLSSDPAVRARFLVEARAAASLDHPNICTIHEVAETADARPFLAMTCYGGETLKDRLKRASIPVDEALELTLEIARGLSAAHERGIVHRDVKPGNVMLVDDGSVKILDFGIAKVGDGTTTDPDLTPGTVAYMSPEQARGDDVDRRTDLWSVGVVLYEMVAGRRPFSGERDGTIIHSILHDEPRPLEEVAPAVPPELAGLVRSLLRKPAAERCGSAEELLRELERIAGEEAGPVPTRRGDPTRRGRLTTPLGVASATAVVFTLAAAGFAVWANRSATATLDPSIVAVLPFRVAGADASIAYLREGMVDLLVHRLGDVERLRPVDSRTLIDAWERAGGRERDLSNREALELGERLGAGRLVMGEVVSLPDRVTLSAVLYDVTTGGVGRALREEGAHDSLPALVDRLAVRLLSLDAGPSARLASITTGSLAALQPYLAGEVAYRRGQYDQAALHFARAVEHDSTFALAALMAARASDKVGPGRIDGDFAALAWRHRERLGPRERTYLEVFGANRFLGYSHPSELLESLQRLVILLPNDPDAWFMLGERIPHSMARAGASDTLTLRHTAEAFRKALALDTTYMPGLTQLQLAEAALGDTAAAFRLMRRYLARVADGTQAEQYRCVLGGTRGNGGISSSDLASLGPAALGRCLLDLHGFYPFAHAARDTVAAYLDRRSDSPEVMALAAPMMYTVALDRGRPREAQRYAAAFRQMGLGWWSYHVSAAVRDALYAEGDSAAAAAAAAEIAVRLGRTEPDLPERQRIEAACALGQWRASSGDHGAAAVQVDRLRALGSTEETGPEVAASHCAALLEAWTAFETGAPDLDEKVAALDHMLSDGARDARLIRESAFLLARIHESRGRPEQAVTAIARARFTRPSYYTSSYFRERARFAVLVDDTAGARNAYRRYLAMRSSPEPSLHPEVMRARTALKRLAAY